MSLLNSGLSRRRFFQRAAAAGLGSTWAATVAAKVKPEAHIAENFQVPDVEDGKRVGIIGLDTSHSTAFTQALNKSSADPLYKGYRVTAAFPQGSSDIKSSTERIAGYTEEVKKYGVEIASSIESLLDKTDVILLETNDGRLHLQQGLQVIRSGKRLFIDKPVAASLADVLAIYAAAEKSHVPVFSSSSLRYTVATQEVAQGKTIGKILGADSFSPCEIEKSHPDLFWYGIHGVESLFTVMGSGCKEVTRTHTPDTDLVVGVWGDGRIGTFRGTRTGEHGYGGTAFGEKGTAPFGNYSGYEVLLAQIIQFYETGIAPVTPAETIEIYAFMEAADESKRRGGTPVSVNATLEKGQRKNRS